MRVKRSPAARLTGVGRVVYFGDPAAPYFGFSFRSSPTLCWLRLAPTWILWRIGPPAACSTDHLPLIGIGIPCTAAEARR